jgi:hypothetical protein
MYYLYTFQTLSKKFTVMVNFDSPAYIKHIDGTKEYMVNENYPPGDPADNYKHFFYAEYTGGDWIEPSYVNSDEYHIGYNSNSGWNIKLGTNENNLNITSGGMVPLNQSIPGGQSDMYVSCNYDNFYEDGVIAIICQGLEKFEKGFTTPKKEKNKPAKPTNLRRK